MIKTEILHDLRIILKSGAVIKVKNVRDWKFGETSYSIKWPSSKDQSIAWINPGEIAGVEIIRKRRNFFWG